MTSLLTATEAAQVLCISRSLLYRLVAEGKLPHYRIASKLLFSEEHLRRFLADSEQGRAA